MFGVNQVPAEPLPGTVAQGVSLPKVREMKALIVGGNQRAAQIRVLRMRGRSKWVASIFATVEIDDVLIALDPMGARSQLSN